MRLLALVLIVLALGGACDAVNEAAGGGRKQFSTASDSFARSTSSLIDAINELFDTGNKETYLQTSTPLVEGLHTDLATMKKAAPDLSGTARQAADDVIDAATRIATQATVINTAVRKNDVDAAQGATEQISGARTAFNSAIAQFRKTG